MIFMKGKPLSMARILIALVVVFMLGMAPVQAQQQELFGYSPQLEDDNLVFATNQSLAESVDYQKIVSLFNVRPDDFAISTYDSGINTSAFHFKIEDRYYEYFKRAAGDYINKVPVRLVYELKELIADLFQTTTDEIYIKDISKGWIHVRQKLFEGPKIEFTFLGEPYTYFLQEEQQYLNNVPVKGIVSAIRKTSEVFLVPYDTVTLKQFAEIDNGYAINLGVLGETHIFRHQDGVDSINYIFYDSIVKLINGCSEIFNVQREALEIETLQLASEGAREVVFIKLIGPDHVYTYRWEGRDAGWTRYDGKENLDHLIEKCAKIFNLDPKTIRLDSSHRSIADGKTIFTAYLISGSYKYGYRNTDGEVAWTRYEPI